MKKKYRKDGRCSVCKELLTLKNASPSTTAHGSGKCRNCQAAYCRNRYGFKPMNYQIPGEEHLFPCGCNLVLPLEKGTKNEFVLWRNTHWRCRKHENLRTNKARLGRKLEVMTHYCGGTPHCQCVGCRNGKENPVHHTALQLDHVNGDGSTHFDNKGYRMGGIRLYQYAYVNNYPKEFQVLCANCNSTACKGNRAHCPFYGQPH